MLSGKRSVENMRYADRSVSTANSSQNCTIPCNKESQDFGIDNDWRKMHEQLKHIEALKGVLVTSTQKEILKNLE